MLQKLQASAAGAPGAGTKSKRQVDRPALAHADKGALLLRVNAHRLSAAERHIAQEHCTRLETDDPLESLEELQDCVVLCGAVYGCSLFSVQSDGKQSRLRVQRSALRSREVNCRANYMWQEAAVGSTMAVSKEEASALYMDIASPTHFLALATDPAVHAQHHFPW